MPETKLVIRSAPGKPIDPDTLIAMISEWEERREDILRTATPKSPAMILWDLEYKTRVSEAILEGAVSIHTGDRRTEMGRYHHSMEQAQAVATT